jgi:hypothetical protein
MPNVICPQCQASFDASVDLGQAHCVRCGQVVTMPRISQAFQVFVERPATAAMNAALELPARYASWEEFRALSPTLQDELLKLAGHPLPDMRSAELRPLPAILPAKVDEFGEPLASLAIPGETRFGNRTIGIAIASWNLLFLIVIGFQLGMPRPAPAGFKILLLAGGIVGMGVGGWYAWFRRPSLAINLWIFHGGLFLERGNEVEACAWADINNLQADPNKGRPIHRITTTADFQVVLSADATPAIMPLAEFIEISITSAQLLTRLRQLFEGKRVKFGAVHLDRAGLLGHHFFARWSDIVRVMINDSNVFIDCRNRPTWHQIRGRNVSFVLLLSAISHIMIEEHSRLGPD